MTSVPTIPLLLLVIGVVPGLWGLRVLWAGIRGTRRGADPHCRNCGYSLLGITSERCPECGTGLSPRNTVRGRPAPHRGLIGVGVLLVAFGVLVVATQGPLVLRRIDWYAFKPTGWVIDDLVSDSPADAARALSHLNGRIERGEATQKQRDRLADIALVEQPEGSPSFQATQMGEWLARWARDGSLSDDRKTKYYEQIMRLSLAARRKVRAGDPVPYRVEYRFAGPGGGHWWYEVEVLGAALDGAPVSDGGAGISSGFGFGSGGGTGGELPGAPPGRHSLAINVRVRIYYGNERIGGEFEAAHPPLNERDVTLTAAVDVLPIGAPDPLAQTDDLDLVPRLMASVQPSEFCRGPGPRQLCGVIRINSVPCDIAFDVVARANGREYPLGSIKAAKRTSAMCRLQGQFDSDAATVDIILRSSDRVARRTVDLVNIWKGELVFPKVPVTAGAGEATTQPRIEVR